MQHAHIISFYSIDMPTLVYWDRCDGKYGNAREISEEMAGYWKISSTGKKSCIGYRREDRMKQCLFRAQDVPQCRRCSWLDIARVHTRLDFTAHEHLRKKFTDRPYSIYLASFGDIIKCGVTKKERVHERVREQGADSWAELMQFDNGEEAYAAESSLQREFGFKNAVRTDTKLKMLMAENKDKKKEAIEEAIQKIKENNGFSSMLLSRAQIMHEDYHVPKEWEVADAHSVDGRILTAKGSLLFYAPEKEEKAKVVDMGRLRGNLAEISR